MKLLLLAGTVEARALAERLAADGRFEVVASLAGATKTPATYAVPLRVGGFGGAEEMEKYIEAKGFSAVIDATHPFAEAMPGRAQGIAARLGLPYLRLLRPGWAPRPDDLWTRIDHPEAVVGIVPPGARVFLAIGRSKLARFAGLAQGRHLVVRVIDPPAEPFPFPQGEWIVGRPPFTLESEIRLLRDHRIDVLVAKDAGGPTAAKLDAARALGLPVVLIERPAPPPAERVETVDAALAWAERLV